MSAPTLLRFGTFGPRGAGKTVTLAAMYRARVGDGVELDSRDTETIRYLRPFGDGLGHGKFPPPTAAKPPGRLDWLAQIGESRYQLQCIDFAGELTDPIWTSGPADWQKRVADWFTKCDAILVFIDSTSSDPVYLDAFDKLLSELERQPTGHGSDRRVIAVVLTKGDELPGAERDALNDPAKCAKLLGRHPLYQRIARQLARLTNQFHNRVFVSSAVGWNFGTSGVFNPCNLFAPLRWAVETAAVVVQRSHHEDLAAAIGELQEWERGQELPIFANYVRKMDELEALNQRVKLVEGPLVNRARGVYAMLQRRWMRQDAMRGGLFTLVFFVAMFGFWCQQRPDFTRDYDEFESLPAAEERGATSARLVFYDKHIAPRRRDWFWGLSDRRRQADERARTDRNLLYGGGLNARDDFESFTNFTSHDGPPGQDSIRHQAILRFLSRRQSHYTDEQWRTIHQVLAKTEPAWKADLDAYEKLRLTVVGAASYADVKLAEDLAMAYCSSAEGQRLMTPVVQTFLTNLHEYRSPRKCYLTVTSGQIVPTFGYAGYNSLQFAASPPVWTNDVPRSVIVRIGDRADDWTDDLFAATGVPTVNSVGAEKLDSAAVAVRREALSLPKLPGFGQLPPSYWAGANDLQAGR